jgi:hypothetical protein
MNRPGDCARLVADARTARWEFDRLMRLEDLVPADRTLDPRVPTREEVDELERAWQQVVATHEAAIGCLRELVGRRDNR